MPFAKIRFIEDSMLGGKEIQYLSDFVFLLTIGESKGAVIDRDLTDNLQVLIKC